MTEFRRCSLRDVIEVTPARHGDDRGFFSEVWNARLFAENGVEADWVQDNQSRSAAVGTVRGLHFQTPPFAQDKLIRVVRGSVFDVAVDLRRGSPTFGRWTGCELSAERWNQLFVPRGFAHGFMTLEPGTEVAYKVSGQYSREHEGAIRWDDPDVAIAWPTPGPPVLSDKDREAPLLRDHTPVFSLKD